MKASKEPPKLGKGDFEGDDASDLTKTIISAASKLENAYRNKDRKLELKNQEIAELKARAQTAAAALKQDAIQESESITRLANEESTKILAKADQIVADSLRAAEEKIVEAKQIAHRTIVSAHQEKQGWEKERAMIAKTHEFDSSKISLDVGGSRFATRLSTLTTGAAGESMLAAMFSGRHALDQDEKDGSYFIDRDGTFFGQVLNYLRDPANFVVPINGNARKLLLKDAEYYQLPALQEALKYLSATNIEIIDHLFQLQQASLSQKGQKNGINRSKQPSQPSSILKFGGIQSETLSQRAFEEITVDAKQLSSIKVCEALTNTNTAYGTTFQSMLERNKVVRCSPNQDKTYRLCLVIDLGENKVRTSSMNIHVDFQQHWCYLSKCDFVVVSAESVPHIDKFTVAERIDGQIDAKKPLDRWYTPDHIVNNNSPVWTRQIVMFLNFKKREENYSLSLKHLSLTGDFCQARNVHVPDLQPDSRAACISGDY